jgi:hypothetical protein
MKPALALVGLAVVGGGIYWATKEAKAAEGPEGTFEPVEHLVVGDSGTTYLVRDLGRRVVEGVEVAILEVNSEDGATRILVYQQYVGDPASRIWDKLAGGLTPNDALWLSAVSDFGIFTSV